jgi:nucleoside 2-deoxyribosyltransferase
MAYRPATDVGGIDWADGVVAIMDGPDPESGTAWEVGYAFGVRKPILPIRTDVRTLAGNAGDYNREGRDSKRSGRHTPDRSGTWAVGQHKAIAAIAASSRPAGMPQLARPR